MANTIHQYLEPSMQTNLATSRLIIRFELTIHASYNDELRAPLLESQFTNLFANCNLLPSIDLDHSKLLEGAASIRSLSNLESKYLCVSLSRLQGGERLPADMTRVLPIHLQKSLLKMKALPCICFPAPWRLQI